MEALRNKIAGLEIAIKLISDGSERTASTRAGKVGVSETILSLLGESSETGLKPQAVIELAAQRGIRLNRGSVYSLLNRMERAGTVVHEDARYKLRVFARGRERAAAFLPSERHHSTREH
jgi:DNA-binding PadR family transcriptional regulator